MDINEKINELRLYEYEREWFEFKENWFNLDELGTYISALSNSAASYGQKYGYFVWGINDKTHDIVGTSFNPDIEKNHEPIKHYLARKMNPDIRFEFIETFIDKKRLVILLVPAAKNIPTSFDGIRYIRIGSSKEKISKYPEREKALFAALEYGLPTIENTPAKYQDLEFNQLVGFYASKGVPLNLNKFKENLGFYTEKGEYNLLAQLLSDNSHFPIRIAIFSGTSKADNMYSVREFGYRCLLVSLDDVLRYGDVLNIIQADEANRVVERREVPLFENVAFREAIINAFLHNRWVDGNEPMITVYSDRIEILSRGTLPPNQTLEGFFAGESIPVNEKLSEVFLQLHISEKTGRGVPRIVEKYGVDAFEFRQNSIVVNIPFNWINVMGDKVGDKKSYNSITSEEKILNAIRDNPSITKPEICKIVGLGKTSIDNYISKLKKKGMIERIGSNKTGYWKVNN